MQDEMINKDTATKQQQKLNDLKNEINSTEESIQTEQLLNLQLSNEYNRLLTDLSHILNQRNSLLLECKGLRNTVSLLNSQYQEIAQSVNNIHLQKTQFDEQLKDIENKVNEWESSSSSLYSQAQQCRHTTLLLISKNPRGGETNRKTAAREASSRKRTNLSDYSQRTPTSHERTPCVNKFT